MVERSIYKNLSPLDHRYFLSNKETFELLEKCLSEEAVVRSCLRVESALLRTYVRLFLGGDSKLSEIAEDAAISIDPDEVYEEEKKTQHNIRALVNVFKRKLPPVLKPYVHLGATSADILDTATALRIRDAVRTVVLPLLLSIEDRLIEIVRRHASTAQVGRTHGQHAVPITFGFALSEYVSRLGGSVVEIDARSRELRGKLAGAVGAYNATSLIVADPEELERNFLGDLGLLPSEHSTQIVEPEYTLRLLLEMNTAFGILANLADDLRNLQRTEIAEVREEFAEGQVGSSTMPQKRNPWNSEHVKSLWKSFAPRVVTFFMDQISDHQRDLTNSASSRFVVDYVAGFCAALCRMDKILASLGIDETRMKRNLEITGDLVLAEAAYVLLSSAGEPDAHEILRRMTLRCDQTGQTLGEELRLDTHVWKLISGQMEKTLRGNPEEFFSDPALYRGKAAEKAVRLADHYSAITKKIREGL